MRHRTKSLSGRFYFRNESAASLLLLFFHQSTTKLKKKGCVLLFDGIFGLVSRSGLQGQRSLDLSFKCIIRRLQFVNHCMINDTKSS